MSKTISAIIFSAAFLLIGSQVAVTQPQDELKTIKKDIEKLKKNQAKLQRELETIKTAIKGRRRAPAAFKPVVLRVGDDPFKGKKNARLTLVDFSDYQ